MTGLLPPNATAFERSLAALAEVALDIPVPIDRLWSADSCPVDMLGYLAWSLAVDEWDGSWDEERQRAVIRAAIPTHRKKGTIGAVKRAIAALGYTAEVRDGFTALTYDGAAAANGLDDFGSGGRWAQFDVIVGLGAAGDLDAASRHLLLRAVEANAPARAHLRRLGFAIADADHFGVTDRVALTLRMDAGDQRTWGNRHDGRLTHDGAGQTHHDGAARHDAGWNHSAWAIKPGGGRYDTAEDRAHMDLHLAASDSVRLLPRHDGRLTHDGFAHGAGVLAADPATLVRVATHHRYGGRHRHGGDCHDGRLTHDGKRSHFSGIQAGGTGIHEQVM